MRERSIIIYEVQNNITKAFNYKLRVEAKFSMKNSKILCIVLLTIDVLRFECVFVWDVLWKSPEDNNDDLVKMQKTITTTPRL